MFNLSEENVNVNMKKTELMLFYNQPSDITHLKGFGLCPIMHLSSVGIRRLRVDALVVDDVLEGSVHVAAIAAVVAVFA